MSSERRIEFRVTGRVQGVGFRWFTRDGARDLGLVGWVRNEADGSVIGAAQGAGDAVAAFEQLLRSGPDLAEVADLEATDCEVVDGESKFGVQR